MNIQRKIIVNERVYNKPSEPYSNGYILMIP